MRRRSVSKTPALAIRSYSSVRIFSGLRVVSIGVTGLDIVRPRSATAWSPTMARRRHGRYETASRRSSRMSTLLIALTNDSRAARNSSVTGPASRFDVVRGHVLALGDNTEELLKSLGGMSGGQRDRSGFDVLCNLAQSQHP